MKEEEIKKLVDGNPRTLIEESKKMGVDFSDINKDIASDMAIELFNIPKNQIQAVDFVFWFAYIVERNAEELIVYPEVELGARKQAIETMVDKLTFGDKIKVIEELYANKKDDFVKFMRKVQNLRNDIAHGRFDNLKYEEYSLSENEGRILLIANLRDTMLNKYS